MNDERDDRFTPTLGRRNEVARSARFSVYLDELSLPGEPDTRQHLVVAPHGATSDGVTGVAVLPASMGRVALIRIHRHAVGIDSWEITRGFLDSGDEAAAAERELLEETGLACAASQLELLGTVSPDTGILAARVRVFLAPDCRGVRPFEPREMGHRELAWFDRQAFTRAVDAGLVHDCYTLFAYYRARDRGAL
jgi:ADP-ribose pyrophosphatase